jgi:hypothetical protein
VLFLVSDRDTHIRPAGRFLLLRIDERLNPISLGLSVGFQVREFLTNALLTGFDQVFADVGDHTANVPFGGVLEFTKLLTWEG